MIKIIDFETTGLPPEADVVEAAFVEVSTDHRLINLNTWSSLVRPSRPVSVEARAAHHISDAELATGIPWEDACDRICSSLSGAIYCAHNADFEKSFFNPEGSRWIDTYKCALRLWPDAPKHTNSVLRYFLDGCDPGEAGMPPHRALPDCHVTARILIKALSMATVEQLIAWSDEPPLLPRVPMGKHFGKPWSEVPTDYLEWATRQDFDAGVAHTVRVELARRSKR
jgi:exodeoxyribonuclease X